MPPPIPRIEEMNPTKSERNTPSQRLNFAVFGSNPSIGVEPRFEFFFHHMTAAIRISVTPKVIEKPGPEK